MFTKVREASAIIVTRGGQFRKVEMSFKGRVRGVHSTRVLKYIKKKRGVVGIENFINHSNTKFNFSPPLSETKYEEKGWYSYAEYLDILEETDSFFGNGDGSCPSSWWSSGSRDGDWGW